MRKIFLGLLIALSSQCLLSQNETWKTLLNNQRSTALKAVNTQAVNSIEDLFQKLIVRNQNGRFALDDSFMETLMQYEDFEYYLYAFWTEEFLFSTYLSDGLKDEGIARLKQIDINAIDNSTIRNALLYLSAISSRHFNQMDAYHEFNKRIPALTHWQYCGPFENLNQSGFDHAYPPEAQAKSSADFNTHVNGAINWYTPLGNETEPYQQFINHSEYGAGVHYAQTFISNPKQQEVYLSVGRGSAIKIWINDQQVYENKYDRTTDLDAATIALTLPKGTNRILIKTADKTDASYFILRLSDAQGKSIEGMKESSVFKAYNSSSLKELNPRPITHSVEQFFLDKLKDDPSNFLYSYALFETYNRNAKYELANAILNNLQKSYPSSSFLKLLQQRLFIREELYDSATDVENDLILNDPDYYYSFVFNLQDYSKLQSIPLEELKAKISKISSLTDQDILAKSLSLIYHLRVSDMAATRSVLEDIVNSTRDWLNVQKTYITMYSSLLNEDEKSLKLLEDLNKRYLDYSVIISLIEKYDAKNQQEKSIALLDQLHSLFANDNSISYMIIEKFISYNSYDKALAVVNQTIKSYPYSAKAYKLKGDILLKQGEKTKALAAYKKSISHGNINASLHRKIKDLTNQPYLTKTASEENQYAFIEKNRNQIATNNYGYTILLDENIIELLADGGNQSRYTEIYEITSEAGIDNFKEYDLGLSGNYTVLKCEVVKADKSVISADRQGSKVVFKNLSIGDVVYFDYEYNNYGSGRFFKDFVDTFQFDSFHPAMKTSYTIFVPDDTTIYHTITNGSIPLTKTKGAGFTKYNWTLNRDLGIKAYEEYMPNTVDIAKYLHITTIKDWNTIAYWYSDLVRNQLVADREVLNTFDQLFPKGVTHLSKEERAKRIYTYMIETLDYSYVSFRQSGFLPQKASKTIRSKLGDCKDFSSLFVTLAELADLKSNLVLILTNDYGQRSLMMPSQDFNHCIVKVELDDGAYFIELTDENLPFKAMPTSLINAAALEIPRTVIEGQNYSLFKLKRPKGEIAKIYRHAKINLADGLMKAQIKTELSGSINSYYVGTLTNPTYENVKKEIDESFKNNLSELFTVDSVYNIKAAKGAPLASYDAQLSIKKDEGSIGSIQIMRLPSLVTVYENSIVSTEQRNFPIEYIQYENVDEYIVEFEIVLPKETAFVQIPKNAAYNFKDQHYSIHYTLKEKNELLVKIEAKTSLENNISVQDYAAFKAYVTGVLNSNKEYIGYQ